MAKTADDLLEVFADTTQEIRQQVSDEEWRLYVGKLRHRLATTFHHRNGELKPGHEESKRAACETCLTIEDIAGKAWDSYFFTD